MNYGCENIGKQYKGRTVLKGLSFSAAPGERVCIAAPSGGGKTTLLHILASLVQPDEGRVFGFAPGRIGMVFQEDRLCMPCSALINVAMVQKRPDLVRIRRALEEILPEDCLDQPVRELSGGMRRRVAAARAVLAENDALLFDEPFAGLDEESRRRTARFLLARQGERPLVWTAHQADGALLPGRAVKL